jgi:translation initiation factor 3 subunit C
MSRFFRQAGDSDSDSETESSEDEIMSSEDEAPRPQAPAPKQAMARFLRTAGSDSSSSESEDESDDDDDDDEESGGDEEKPGARILSAQEKRLKEMEATGKAMDNGLKINDWSAISTGEALFIFDYHPGKILIVNSEFDKLLRMVQRQHNVSEPVPPFYLKTITNLESSVNGAIAKEKEAKKKMNALNAKALTAMRQKIKKALKEHETEIKKYQEVCSSIYRGWAGELSQFTGPGDLRARLCCSDCSW